VGAQKEIYGYLPSEWRPSDGQDIAAARIGGPTALARGLNALARSASTTPPLTTCVVNACVLCTHTAEACYGVIAGTYNACVCALTPRTCVCGDTTHAGAVIPGVGGRPD
jgi:hypothetical protein